MSNDNNGNNNKIRRKKVSSSANKSTTSKSANSNSPRTKSSKKKSSKKKDKFKALRVTGIVLLVMLVCLSAAGTGLVFASLRDVQPVTKALLDEKTYQTTEIRYANGDLLSNAPSVNKKDPIKIDQIPKDIINAVVSIEDERFYEHNGVDSLSLSFIHSYFHELILFILRCQMYEDNVITKMDTGNELIQKVIEYIIENYHNDITMAATAELFNMSESSLSKKFKAFTGFRFREYLINVRTHAAADLLVNTSLSITEIADKCGFADSNTMGGTFKKIMGEAPGSYRKSH